MSDKEAQVGWDDDGYLDIDECHAEIKRLHVKLADICAARDAVSADRQALAAELADARRVALSYLRKTTKCKRDLAQAREELAETEADFVTAARTIGKLREELAANTQQEEELIRIRWELRDVRSANRALGQQVADVTKNRDYWYDKALEAEAERDELRGKAQEQSDEAQRDWLSPVEAGGLRRQLKHMEGERDFWLKEHDALAHGCHSETTTELSERLATLDAAEKALDDCGIAKFDSLADAIMQMSSHIIELEKEPMVEVEITGKEMVEALQSEHRARKITEAAAHVLSKAIDECMQTVHTERALRQEAEQCCKNAKAELCNGHRALTAAGTLRDNEWGRLTICGRVMRLRQRTTRAEALAQLVTPGLAALLKRLASRMDSIYFATKDGKRAEAFAAQIREALDEH